MKLGYILIILAAVAVILKFIDKIVKKDELNWTNYLLLFIAIIVCVVSVKKLKNEIKSKKYNSETGKIEGKANSQSEKVRQISIGGSTLVTDPGKGPFSFFDMYGDKLDAWTIDGKLYMNAIVRNTDGKVVAKIIANEWKINPNSTFDKNHDKWAIEVINDRDEVILQLDYKNGKAQFAAKFYFEDGEGVFMGPNAEGGGLILKRKAHPESFKNLKINPIFKYPSNSNKGQRIKSK